MYNFQVVLKNIILVLGLSTNLLEPNERFREFIVL